MNVIPLKAYSDNYIWCLKRGEELYCVDPGDAQPVLDFLLQSHLKLHGILITHHHLDHIGGIHELVKRYPNIQIFAPKDARIPCVTHPMPEKKKSLPYGLQMIEIPGHTSTHIAYVHEDEHILFCGDTLFSGGCGRVFDGTLRQLYASLNQLKALPDETRVYCGHEYTQANLRFALHVEPDNLVARHFLDTLMRAEDPCSLPSTIGLEKQINPFFRLDSPTIVDYVARKKNRHPGVFEIFEQLREDKNSWSG